MKIAVDLDSTLYDFSTPFRQAFLDLALEHEAKEEYFKGGYQSWVEWRSPADVCGMEAFLEALAIVHSPEVIAKQRPFDHSQDVLRDLFYQGHELLYISNRSSDEEVFAATEEWLLGYDFPQGELVCMMDDKQPYIRDCQYLIDDRPKTLCDFVYSPHQMPFPRKGFGLMFEYNRALTDIPNIYLAPTWSGIKYYLTRKGVLDGRSSISSGSSN